MKLPSTAVILVLFALQSHAPAVGASRPVPPVLKSYFVSPRGSDAWSGALPDPNIAGTDGPFLTLARSQQALRSSKTIKTVALRAGTYPLPSPLLFDSTDSGESWIAYRRESPEIDGAGTGYITFQQTVAFTIEGLTFKNFGFKPMSYTFQIVAFNSSRFVIRWNKFVGCRYSCFFGVFLSDSIIDSNVVDGQSPGGPPGKSGIFYSTITLSNGSSNNRVTHNLIENAQGGGIALIAGVPDHPNNDDQIDRNLLRNTVSDVVDAGAIYLEDRTHSATGNRVTNNVIEGVGGPNYVKSWTKAIYLDDLTSNVLVAGNICYVTCGEHAVQIHGGDHNRITGNIFALSGATMVGLYDDEQIPAGVPNGPPKGGFASPWMADNVFDGNIIYSLYPLHSPLWQTSLHDPHMVLPEDKNNIIFASNAAAANAGPIIDKSVVYADPEFANPRSGNFEMPPNSPARTRIGFPVLPTDQGPLPRPSQFPANP